MYDIPFYAKFFKEQELCILQSDIKKTGMNSFSCKYFNNSQQ